MYLVDLGARVNARTATGETPLHKACDTRIARFLIDAGADIEAVDNRGNTPLLVALWNGQPNVAEYLSSQGADPKGFTPGATA